MQKDGKEGRKEGRTKLDKKRTGKIKIMGSKGKKGRNERITDERKKCVKFEKRKGRIKERRRERKENRSTEGREPRKRE